MGAWLFLAVAPLQFPFGEPPNAVFREDPEPACLAGEWRALGPLPARTPETSASLPAGWASSLQTGQPWTALDESFAVKGGAPLLWRDVDFDALADAAAKNFLHPRERVGLETGRIELRRIPILGTAADRSSAFFYCSVHARDDFVWPAAVSGRGTLRVWLNGRLVGESPQGGMEQFTRLPLSLRRGLNHLLIESVAADDAWWFELRSAHPLTQPRINRAVDAGMQFLLSRQLPDGSWTEWPGYPSGTTALALFALMKSGLPRDHAAAQRALAALRRTPPQQVYAIALTLLAVNAFGDSAHNEWIEELAGDLIASQAGNGLWAYPEGVGDLSNTQFAALALHAAAQRGVKVPHDTWRELSTATIACQPSANGRSGSRARGIGFGYYFGGQAYASMTAAGIGTLRICALHLGDAAGKRVLSAADAGVIWLGENCPLHAALGHGEGWTTYMLYGLERAGALMDTQSFGEHAWYPEGAAWLLERQRANGAWSMAHESDVDSSFALLFLTRATAQAAITQPGGDTGAGRLFASSSDEGPLVMRAALDPDLRLWVDANSRDFTRYARVVYWLRAPGGDWKPLEGGRSKRFDASAALDAPGLWQLRASAFLHDGSSVGSGTIEIVHEAVSNSKVAARQATAHEDNLLRGGMCEASASSTGVGSTPNFVCDQVFSSRWMCAVNDLAPSLEIKLGRRTRGRAIVIHAARWLPVDSEQQAEPARVRLTINGSETRILDLPASLPGRWELDLGKELEVKTLRIEIQEIRRGALGACSVGFSEIELLKQASARE